MNGTMGGYYEIRVTGPARAQYRLFRRLGNGTLGDDYLATLPRRIAMWAGHVSRMRLRHRPADVAGAEAVTPEMRDIGVIDTR